MAILIPPKPHGTVSPSVARMFRTLRRLPDNYIVWFALHTGLPHFLVLWKDRHGFLIQVASTTQQLAESALQRSFFDESHVVTPEELGEKEKAVMERFVKSAGVHIARDLPLRRLVVFPNVDQSTIDRIELLRSTDHETAFLGMRQSDDEGFVRRLEALAEAPLGERELIALRKEFTPESMIHESCRPLPLARRGIRTEESPGFLDFAQESLVKLDIELSPQAERTAENPSVRLVTGLAGSGKSLVLLHRAIQAARLHPEAKLLVLTHNRPINGELQRRFEAIADGRQNVVWKTFFGWLISLGSTRDRIIGQSQSRRIVERLQSSIRGLERYTASFLADELDYIRDLAASRDDYLALERKGRSTGLNGDARKSVWQLLETYRDKLRETRQTDWHELALRFHKLAIEKPERFQPGYDFIFIDEAQFFAKSWFAPVNAALRPGGQLFLSADPTQGFLKRRQSWLEAGINIRGRSCRLEKPYRTTRRLMAFATTLFQLHASGGVADGDDLADHASLAAIDELGEWPEITMVASPQQEILAAAERVQQIRDQWPDHPGHVLLLHTVHQNAQELIEILNQKLGPGSACDAKNPNPANRSSFCTVSSLNAVTGLEAAIVFVLGLDRLLEDETDPRLDTETLAELRSVHAKMMYVATTRAARRLVIYAKGKALEHLLRTARDKAMHIIESIPAPDESAI
jgi:hypothetical protein